ncbi:MAG: response regulator [Nitrospirae bacterium]|nr:response regulator [Nitrospirota bacterium]
MDDKEKILIIDDELIPRYSIQQVLKDRYSVFTAAGGAEGLDFMAHNHADLVVLDIRMPDMDGITVLKEIKKRFPDTEVVLLTAYASLESARSAVRFGALDYLIKPFDKSDVINVVERGLQKKRVQISIKSEREKLLDKTKYLECQVNKAREKMMMYDEGTVNALILAIDAKDHYTSDHSGNVARLSYLIAEILGLPKEECNKLRQAGIIHDIGKIGIDEAILRKKGPLTKEEFIEMKKHSEIGARIVNAVPFMGDTAQIIYYHHERFDGTGYPEGLKEEEIPVPARIVAIADAVDSMMHDRPYRARLPVDEILTELKVCSGTQFDPVIVDAILKSKKLLK